MIKRVITCSIPLLVFCIVSLYAQGAWAVKSTCDFQHRECFTEAGYPACKQRVYIVKYYEFLDKENDVLAEQIIADTDKCIVLTGNEKAFMQDKSSGFVKFGLRGKNITYWAKSEALFSRSP